MKSSPSSTSSSKGPPPLLITTERSALVIGALAGTPSSIIETWVAAVDTDEGGIATAVGWQLDAAPTRSFEAVCLLKAGVTDAHRRRMALAPEHFVLQMTAEPSRKRDVPTLDWGQNSRRWNRRSRAIDGYSGEGNDEWNKALCDSPRSCNLCPMISSPPILRWLFFQRGALTRKNPRDNLSCLRH